MIDNDVDKLVQQATIVSTMMLALARGFHGDYGRKHQGAVWEDFLVAFVLWHADTVTNPMSVADIVKILGIPRSNVDRSLAALEAAGMVCKAKRQRWARDVRFISVRPGSTHFADIRIAVITAGRELDRVFA